MTGKASPRHSHVPNAAGSCGKEKRTRTFISAAASGTHTPSNNLRQEQGDAIETALWAAMRALEEKAALETRLWGSLTDDRMIERLKEQAEADRDHAETIRRMLFEQEVGHDKKQTEEQSRSAD
jgi:hypothetical protein